MELTTVYFICLLFIKTEGTHNVWHKGFHPTSSSTPSRARRGPPLSPSSSPALSPSCLPKENVTDHVIDIAVLVPSAEPHDYTPCTRDHVMPVVHLAVEHVRKNELLGPLKGWNISIHYKDTNCSSTFGPLASVDLFLSGKAGT